MAAVCNTLGRVTGEYRTSEVRPAEKQGVVLVIIVQWQQNVNHTGNAKLSSHHIKSKEKQAKLTNIFHLMESISKMLFKHIVSEYYFNK